MEVETRALNLHQMAREKKYVTWYDKRIHFKRMYETTYTYLGMNG